MPAGGRARLPHVPKHRLFALAEGRGARPGGADRPVAPTGQSALVARAARKVAGSSERAVEQAAVQKEILASDVAGASAAQERAGVAELGWIADPPRRHAVPAPLGISSTVTPRVCAFAATPAR